MPCWISTHTTRCGSSILLPRGGVHHTHRFVTPLRSPFTRSDDGCPTVGGLSPHPGRRKACPPSMSIRCRPLEGKKRGEKSCLKTTSRGIWERGRGRRPPCVGYQRNNPPACRLGSLLPSSRPPGVHYRRCPLPQKDTTNDATSGRNGKRRNGSRPDRCGREGMGPEKNIQPFLFDLLHHTLPARRVRTAGVLVRVLVARVVVVVAGRNNCVERICLRPTTHFLLFRTCGRLLFMAAVEPSPFAAAVAPHVPFLV